jgi:hypothetical protein
MGVPDRSTTIMVQGRRNMPVHRVDRRLALVPLLVPRIVLLEEMKMMEVVWLGLGEEESKENESDESKRNENGCVALADLSFNSLLTF